MLINSSTTVQIQIYNHSPPSKLTLTPYLPIHVRRYHAWMQDPDIRELTASDPLTLEEEYAMQRSWRSDADKLTFIVYHHPHHSGHAGDDETKDSIHIDTVEKSQRLPSEEEMVGDVNLFLFRDDDEEQEEAFNPNDDVGNESHDGTNGNDTNKQAEVVVGELELMLAEPSARGRGLGSAVLLAFLMYVAKHEQDIVAGFVVGGNEGEGGRCSGRGGNKNNKIEYLRVRIAKDNIPSLKLFEGLGFKRTSAEPNYFGEIEMRRYPSAATGWEGDVKDMMREKRLDGWEEMQIAFD